MGSSHMWGEGKVESCLKVEDEMLVDEIQQMGREGE